MMPGRWLLVTLLAIAASGCARIGVDPTSSPTTSASPTRTGTTVMASWSPVLTPEPDPTDAPGHDERYTPIDTLTLRDGGSRIRLAFVGAKKFSPDDPCSAEYAATTAVVDGVLEIGLGELRRPVRAACDAMGYGRTLDVDLAVPFRGTAWRDKFGPYLHFLAAPPGLVEIPLPGDWRLVGERDVAESPTGRWERTYSPFVGAPPDRSLVLYQSFDGPVNVTGGTEERQVTVAGQPATLYLFPPTGELVLVWMLGTDGLALVADEQVISIPALIAIAESARASEP